MYGFIISKKMDKCRENIQTYINSGNPQHKRNQSIGINRTSSQAFPQSTSQVQVPSSQSQIKSSSKSSSKNQIQLENVAYNGKKYGIGEPILKYLKDEGLMTVLFYDQVGKMKLDIKREDLKGKRISFQQEKRGIIGFAAKTMMVRRLDDHEANKNSNQWVTEKREKQSTFYVTVKNKDQIKQFKQSSFCEGVINAESSSQYLQNVRITEFGANQEEEDHINPKFTVPTPQKLAQTDKLRRIIRQMKEDDKVAVLMDIFKIKKQYDDPLGFNKKLKCPVFKCGKPYRQIQQLKTHLKTKHPQLGRHGIELTQYDGSFEYTNKALDLALYLGKTEPNQIKKIVKNMKTKAPIQ